MKLRHLLATTSLFFLFASTACAYKQTQVSQEGMRQTLLNLYQDQVMDNLIRTKNNLPILQLAYSNAVGTVTNETEMGGRGGQSDSPGTFNFPAGVTGAFEFYATQQVNDQISVTADPVLTPSVAKTYKDYAGKIKLLTSAKKPKPGTFHVMRKYGDTYYYIDESDVDSQVAFVDLYNEASQAEAPKPSKAFDQLLNEETKQRLNNLIR